MRVGMPISQARARAAWDDLQRHRREPRERAPPCDASGENPRDGGSTLLRSRRRRRAKDELRDASGERLRPSPGAKGGRIAAIAAGRPRGPSTRHVTILASAGAPPCACPCRARARLSRRVASTLRRCANLPCRALGAHAHSSHHGRLRPMSRRCANSRLRLCRAASRRRRVAQATAPKRRAAGDERCLQGCKAGRGVGARLGSLKRESHG
mmetsp:Transcript_88088/g.245214  ORF Transcript_88088/g.245214 Transcript_88088/m.245214 type:complete len:211 (-) Transcript_88088:106-738(-)